MSIATKTSRLLPPDTNLKKKKKLARTWYPLTLPQGFGWAIAKMLAEAGAEISLGVWVPALNIFETSLRRGKVCSIHVGSSRQTLFIVCLNASD